MDHDALIVGGGLVGGALALALAREGASVALIDPRPDALPTPRAYALAPASCRLLLNLGLWPRLAPDAQPILSIAVSDGRLGEAPSPLHLLFEGWEAGESPMGHMVEDRALRPALDAALADEPRVARVAGTVASQDAGEAAVAATLADGRTLRAAALLGCDGRASPTARRAGIPHVAWTYGQAALTVTLAHAPPHGRPHHGRAHQLFLPGGPLAVLPLAGDRCAVVWSDAEARARALAADPAAAVQALQAALGHLLGRVALDGPVAAHPLGLSLAHRFVAPRVALAGDAARAVHPVAGQGLNAGLRDAAVLAEALGDARARGEDIGTLPVLEAYERARRPPSVALALATDGFTRLFSNDRPLLRPLRDLGMAAVGRAAPLRRAFAREAAGLRGEPPRLMR